MRILPPPVYHLLALLLLLLILMSVPVFGVAGVSHPMAEITGLDTNLNTIPDKAEGLHDSTQADQTLTPNEIQKRLVQPQCNPGETLTGIRRTHASRRWQ